MFSRFHTLLSLLATVLLAACGGGGSGLLVDHNNEYNQSSSQIFSEFTGIQDSSTSYLATDIFYHTTNRDEQECSDAECVLSRNGQTTNISKIDFSYIEYESAMTRNDVKMAQGAGETKLPGQGFNEDGEKADAFVEKLKYAGWMDHGFFWVQYTLVDQYTERDGYDYQHVIGAAIGESSGAVPSRGSATWEGVMVGADLARAQEGFYKKYLEWLQGDALLTADFQNTNMDVEFNDIRNLTDGAIHGTDSIAFNDIPFTSDGFASLSRPGNRISGTFYGSDQEEVGGIFEHGTIVGSFGGIRQ